MSGTAVPGRPSTGQSRISPRRNLDPWALLLVAYLAIVAVALIASVVAQYGPLAVGIAVALPGSLLLTGVYAAGLFGRASDRADLDNALRRLAALEREHARLNADVRGGLVDA